MEIYTYLINHGLSIIAVVLIGVGLFLVNYLYTIMNKTFGFKFLRHLMKSKILSGKGFLMLEIKHRSGAREYQTVKQSPIIKYKFKENDKEKEKLVLYDPKAIDYIAGIPVLSCSTNSVLPIDRETGLSVYIPPELIDKLAKDNAMDYEARENHSKIIKQFIWGIGIVAVVFLLSISYMYGNVSDLTAQLLVCERTLAQSATIVGG